MKKSRTGSPAGEALASPLVATTQVPLPLLRLNRIASGGAAPKNVPDPARRAYRGGAVGEVALGGGRPPPARPRAPREIGRASCRGREEISVGAGSFKKKKRQENR